MGEDSGESVCGVRSVVVLVRRTVAQRVHVVSPLPSKSPASGKLADAGEAVVECTRKAYAHEKEQCRG